jgi:hypothetical protein
VAEVTEALVSKVKSIPKTLEIDYGKEYYNQVFEVLKVIIK